MTARGIFVGLLACVALTGCGAASTDASADQPFELPIGPTEWDVVEAPAWLHDGTLHVGAQRVELGDGVDEFVLGATGAYWMRRQTLMFTSAEGSTQRVHDLEASGLAVSADRSVLATVDQSRGPTDDYGTHVLQAVVFDARTGEQLYRTPDREPDEGDDLADLYEEITPLLHGVSQGRLFFDGATIDLGDGSSVPAGQDSDGVDVYEGYAETLFPHGYHVSLRGEGRHRELDESSMFPIGRLSPDRSTIFDVGTWPSEAVVYDASTGRQRPLDAPWPHFTLGGWSDEDTFFGVAQQIDDQHPVDSVRARQVVTCELRSLVCTPASPVIATDDDAHGERSGVLLEGVEHRL